MSKISFLKDKFLIFPRPRLEVTEHQLGEIECCGEKYYGEFPRGVENPVQYGTKIKALSVSVEQ